MVTRLSGWHEGERGFLTLIGLLLVIVIIGIMMAMYGGMPGGGGGGPASEPGTVLGGTRGRALDAVCRNNLGQLRAAVSVYQANAQENPPSLESLNAGIALACPEGDEPYQYDPETGKVRCLHPGHGAF